VGVYFCTQSFRKNFSTSPIE